jgi:hypothetical protein
MIIPLHIKATYQPKTMSTNFRDKLQLLVQAYDEHGGRWPEHHEQALFDAVEAARATLDVPSETKWPTAPAPAEGAYLSEGHREAIHQAVVEALGSGAYDCLRVWEAWGVGTMGPDDFALIAEDSDRVAEIADAAVKAFFDAATRAFIPPYPAQFLRPSMDDVMDLAKAFKLEVNDPHALMWLVVTALASWGDIRLESIEHLGRACNVDASTGAASLPQVCR